MNYIYIGSFERRWKFFNWAYKIKTNSCLVMVNYNTEYDSILEEHVMFNEGDDSLILTKKITITDFEKQVVERYTKFIVNNINLLRK